MESGKVPLGYKVVYENVNKKKKYKRKRKFKHA